MTGSSRAHELQAREPARQGRKPRREPALQGRELQQGRGPAARAVAPWFALRASALLAAFAAGLPTHALGDDAPTIATPAAERTRPASAELAFRIDEGRNINSFVRDGVVAAHLVLRSGTRPRVLVAFPAGNSGVAVWFADTARPLSWTLAAAPRPVTLQDSRGRALHGIEAVISSDAPALNVKAAVLSSVRVLRDYEALGRAPPEVLVDASASEDRIVWARDRLDGAAGYRLSIEALDAAKVSTRGIAAGDPRGPLRLKLIAVSGEQPLAPLVVQDALTSQAGRDPRSRNALVFLSYQEKFLAGSWRFNTYFGRDTLISLALLAPVLQPDAFESGLASVLARLAGNGEAAHEEDIGEFAVLRNAREGRGRIDTPIYDYGMIDDDFLLAPVAVRFLLDERTGHARARRFLAESAAGREPNGAALARNLVWVVDSARAFAAAPRSSNLVAIKPGRTTGQWRDSKQGLGYGRSAYDVNVVFVPAALDAAARLLGSGLLDTYLRPEQRDQLAGAGAHARIWSEQAPPFFSVTVTAAQARSRVAAYAARIGVDARAALASLGDDALTFNALSLDAAGRAVPILHSDEGFRLLLADPAPADLERSIESVMRPFPAGLMTEVGLLVANPVLADARLQGEFTSADYHGTVVWSWQHAVLAAGLERQLHRTDLPDSLRAQLVTARARLWRAIESSSAVRTSELWSWSYAGGRYRVEPFGERGAHVDESNAAQLWSTVFLGLEPP